MIPLSLTLRGMYSYRSDQTIDFTKLTESQLFGIFGPVGSGKSTILEAITYVLYGKIERLDKNDELGNNLKNLASEDLFIGFNFLAGNNFSEEYWFEVHHPGRKKSHTFKRAQKIKVNGEWETRSISAEAILGLSYDNFKRTIIIPQGRFQEFLQLGDAERTKMMQDIFNLDRFDLAGKVKELYGETKNRQANIEGQLFQFGDITAETIDQKQQIIRDGKTALAQLETERKQLEAKLKASEQLGQLFAKLADFTAKNDQMNQQAAVIKARRKRLSAYQYCLANFSTLLSKLDEQNTQLEQIEGLLQSKSAIKKTLEKEQKQHEESFGKIKADFEQREQLNIAAEELGRLRHMRELNNTKSGLDQQIAEMAQQIAQEIQTGEQISGEKATVIATTAALKKQVTQTTELHEIDRWFLQQKQLTQSLNEEKARLKSVREKLAANETERAESLAGIELEFWQGSKKIGQSLDELLADAATTLESLAGEIAGRAHDIQHLKVQAQLETFAASLQPGEACPLCGATEHPAPMSTEYLAKTVAQQDKHLQTLRDQQTALQGHVQQWQILAERQKNLQDDRVRLQQQIAEKEAELKQLRSDFHWENFSPDDQAAVATALANAAHIQQQLTAAESQRESVDERIERNRSARESLVKQQSAAQTQLAVVNSELASLAKQFRVIKPDDFKDAAPETIEEQIRGYSEKYRRIEADFHDAEAHRTQIHEQLLKIGVELNTAESRRETVTGQIAALEQSLAQAIEASEFSDMAHIRGILENPVDIEQEQDIIATFEQEKHTLETQIAQLQKETDGKSFSPLDHSELETRQAQLAETIDQQNRLVIETEKEIADIAKKIELRKGLEAEQNSIAARLDNLAVLQKMFKGRGFVNYVSRIYLQHLCHSANLRFQPLTRQQLALELNGDQFVIRDYLNGGETRSVKTLSGGQTFQASLCLALALADHVHKLSRAKQNFFFLDEGFGTLDRESLRLVFDTLKALRNENRIVGVISHVEEMQQEIDVFLKVSNNPETGSTITCSWEA